MPFGLPDTLSSELDAVNFVMKAKGLDLVTEIDLGDADTADAAFHLNLADKGFQSKGWYFNKDYALSLTVSDDGTIPLPEGTLSVAGTYWSGGWGFKNVTERAGKLYDLDNKTFTFTAPVVVDIAVRIAYQDMPEVARQYVAIKAAHVAQALDTSIQSTMQITAGMVLEALTQVEWKQDETTPVNQVHSNISVQSAVNGWGGMARSRTT